MTKNLMNKISDNKIYIFIVLASLLIYIPYIQSFDLYQECRNYQSGDSFWYEEIAISIIEDFDLNMENNIEPRIHVTGALAMSSGGYLVPKHSILFSIATIPFYLLFGPIGAMYFNLALIILLNVIIYAINRVFFSKNVSLITAFLFATGTIIMSYSYNYLGSVFSKVLLSLGILYVLRKRYFSAAIILGFSCFAKISNVPWVGIVFLFIFLDYIKNKVDWKQKKSILKEAIEFSSIGIIFLISLLPVLITNYFLYGGIFTTGYHRTISLDEKFNLFILDGANGFSQELGAGLYNLLFHPTLGVVEANPIIIIALIGAVMIKKMEHQTWAIMLLIIIVGQFLLFAKWDMWYATEFGNRFLMVAIVLFSPFTGNVINVLLKKLRNDDF
jgi:hypothetical protein